MDGERKPPKVSLASFYLPQGTGNPKMFADLNFLAPDGDIVCTVKGFKLMSRENGGFWLGVPQRKHNEDYIDVFEFGSKSQAEEARALLHAIYETEVAKREEFR